MPSDTNPLPAQELLKLADEMAVQIITHNHTQMNWTAVVGSVKAYRAARAASPVTLEEQMLIMGNRFENDQLTLEQEEEWERTTREHARRLAGEGGGQ